VERRIVIVIFDGFQLLDLARAAGVFSAANQITDESCYPLELTATHAGPVTAGNGIQATASGCLREPALASSSRAGNVQTL
jgi:transcriptional regulator GlxA family with amidase domain